MKLLKKVVVHSISRKTFGKAFDLACGSRLSRLLIKPYIRLYKVNREEIRHPSQYKSLTDFFVRDICPSLRPIAAGADVVVSPVDGKIVDLGVASQNKIVLAKNNTYSIPELLSFQDVEAFQDGYYLNIYLSPKNYHRIHMPFGAKVVKHRYVPGKVFPVNNLGVSTIKDLFAKNRRTCTVFQTATGRKFALIKVGALGVGKIVSNFQVGQAINKGDEIGRFEFGSTVILLFEKNCFLPDKQLAPGLEVKMGQKIGIII
ncbi:archaetidylserine decarboxylase [Desulforamulus hydrothermalis]|uniref:phosphatidylserine decarboxylase n=1 Tax=Desulforamulus hydrothermalis Lam5 = DSM 18033 TaxID=1121428 RepID=K8E9F4_9FIRM|nr:archaetidylserine decarboxylase [Desulforamulus hydrothermalis]CCO08193.1 Phosphatidylserine decarboxylase proenzyme [Desulforamulus hydrothermalis Lam5 = DSM 18033]SHH22761.1 phosphatidylserine decarboxylase [Desulforamulus hydrothermalis Lam5 = DSM 18033]